MDKKIVSGKNRWMNRRTRVQIPPINCTIELSKNRRMIRGTESPTNTSDSKVGLNPLLSFQMP